MTAPTTERFSSKRSRNWAGITGSQSKLSPNSHSAIQPGSRNVPNSPAMAIITTSTASTLSLVPCACHGPQSRRLLRPSTTTSPATLAFAINGTHVADCVADHTPACMYYSTFSISTWGNCRILTNPLFSTRIRSKLPTPRVASANICQQCILSQSVIPAVIRHLLS